MKDFSHKKEQLSLHVDFCCRCKTARRGCRIIHCNSKRSHEKEQCRTCLFQVRDGAAASLSSSGCLGDLFFYESLKLGVDS